MKGKSCHDGQFSVSLSAYVIADCNVQLDGLAFYDLALVWALIAPYQAPNCYPSQNLLNARTGFDERIHCLCELSGFNCQIEVAG